VDARYYATLAGIGERRSRRSSAPNDLARNTFLAALHDRNEYAAIAQAAGLHSVRIEQPAEVRSALAEAMAHPDPVLIDLVTDPMCCRSPRTSPRPKSRVSQAGYRWSHTYPPHRCPPPPCPQWARECSSAVAQTH
jgi:hypothetical protein